MNEKIKDPKYRIGDVVIFKVKDNTMSKARMGKIIGAELQELRKAKQFMLECDDEWFYYVENYDEDAFYFVIEDKIIKKLSDNKIEGEPEEKTVFGFPVTLQEGMEGFALLPKKKLKKKKK